MAGIDMVSHLAKGLVRNVQPKGELSQAECEVLVNMVLDNMDKLAGMKYADSLQLDIPEALDKKLFSFAWEGRGYRHSFMRMADWVQVCRTK